MAPDLVHLLPAPGPMWGPYPQRGDADKAPPAVWFQYSPDRQGEHPQRHLKNFSGILQADGFAVTTEASYGTLLIRHKLDNGIPQEMISCHTGETDGYFIEGHVPPADIRRLLLERPDAVGLAVPGMPYGSPGMGPEDNREAYEVFLIRRDGSTEIFNSYEAA